MIDRKNTKVLWLRHFAQIGASVPTLVRQRRRRLLLLLLRFGSRPLPETPVACSAKGGLPAHAGVPDPTEEQSTDAGGSPLPCGGHRRPRPMRGGHQRPQGARQKEGRRRRRRDGRRRLILRLRRLPKVPLGHPCGQTGGVAVRQGISLYSCLFVLVFMLLLLILL